MNAGEADVSVCRSAHPARPDDGSSYSESIRHINSYRHGL